VDEWAAVRAASRSNPASWHSKIVCAMQCSGIESQHFCAACRPRSHANIAQMINAPGHDPDDKRNVLTPLLHIQNVRTVPDATVVPFHSTLARTARRYHVASCDAIAAKDKAGKLWLAITNVDPNQSAEIEVTLLVINAKSVAGETLSASKVDSVNTFDAPIRCSEAAFRKSARRQADLKLAPKS